MAYVPAMTTYAAEYRNWYWQHEKRGSSALKLSGASHHYPAKSDPISDEAIGDSGGNFGRIARTNMMDGFKRRLFIEELSGIPIEAWIRFLAIFSQNTTYETIVAELDRMTAAYAKKRPSLSNEAAERIKANLAEIVDLLSPE